MESLDVKKKISQTVAEYKKIFADEYSQFLSLKKRKEPLNSYAQFKGLNLLERHLLDYPESLYIVIKRTLSDEELKWFLEKESQRWFAREFREFAVPEKI